MKLSSIDTNVHASNIRFIKGMYKNIKVVPSRFIDKRICKILTVEHNHLDFSCVFFLLEVVYVISVLVEKKNLSSARGVFFFTDMSSYSGISLCFIFFSCIRYIWWLEHTLNDLEND